MLSVKEQVSLKGKTTMRIGGIARYFAELQEKDDVDAAFAFAREKNVPLIMIGGGSNTIFADGEIAALVVRIAARDVTRDGNRLTIEAGKNLMELIMECAKEGLDLSPLTGILGAVGGAIFGNAGQGPAGVWMDRYVVSVDAFVDGAWRTFTKEECGFAYRESTFKHMHTPIIWSVTLDVPSRASADIEKDIQALIQRRLDTQPHVKTAGSCFVAVDGTPAWKLIDAAGMRGYQVGGVQVAEKHANFLLNTGDATFADAVTVVEDVRKNIGDVRVEMRFIEPDGSLRF